MPRKKEVKGAYERGNGWRIDTFYKGIRIRERASTPEEAERIIRDSKLKVDNGTYLAEKKDRKLAPDRLLKNLTVRYLRWCEIEGQKAVWDKKKRLERIVQELGENLPVTELTAVRIEKYKAMRLDSQKSAKSKEKIRPATVNRELAYLRHMLTKAVEWGLLDENPMKTVKQLKETNRSLRYLDAKEIKALTDASSPYLRAIITVALNTGLRYSELMRLRWDDIDYRTNHLVIRDQKNGELSYVPMNSATVKTFKAFPRRIDSPHVFSKANGNPPIDFRRRWTDTVAKAEIKPCRFHDLRHTFASHLVMKGTDLITVKELLRHKTIAMTLRYSHLSPQHKQRAVENLTFDQAVEEAAESG